MWKFSNFLATLIFTWNQFWSYQSAKNCYYDHLNFWEFLTFKGEIFPKVKIQSLQNCFKWQFLTFGNKPILFSLLIRVGTRKIAEFPHCGISTDKFQLGCPGLYFNTFLDWRYSPIDRFRNQGPIYPVGQIQKLGDWTWTYARTHWSRKWGQSWDTKGHVKSPGRGSNLEIEIQHRSLRTDRGLGKCTSKIIGKSSFSNSKKCWIQCPKFSQSF